MAFGLTFKLTGGRRVQALLAKIPRRVRTRTLRIALSAGGGVIKRATQARAPRETGLLRRSMRVKPVKVSFGKGTVAYRVMPKSDKRMIDRTKTGKLRVVGKKRAAEAQAAGGRRRYRNPSQYAHLVEQGHKLRRKGRTYGKVSASHFMRKSFRASKRQAMRAIITKIRQGIAQLRAK